MSDGQKSGMTYLLKILLLVAIGAILLGMLTGNFSASCLTLLRQP